MPRTDHPGRALRWLRASLGLASLVFALGSCIGPGLEPPGENTAAPMGGAPDGSGGSGNTGGSGGTGAQPPTGGAPTGGNDFGTGGSGGTGMTGSPSHTPDAGARPDPDEDAGI